MHGRARAALAATLALLICPAAPAAPGLETMVQDDALLLHRSTEEVDAAMARLAELGADRVRLTANWSVLTRDADSETKPAGFDARDPAAYEQARWRGLDQAVALARDHGLRVLIDIGMWAPHWAADDPPGSKARTNIDPAAFADFAAAVARRYSGTFVPPTDFLPPPAPSADESLLEQLLGPRDDEPEPEAPPPPPGDPVDAVDQIALGNEPNHPGLLLPQWDGHRAVSPAHYRLMLRAAYPAVREAHPGATVLVGNTSSVGSVGAGAVPPLRFVRELACVGRDLRPRPGLPGCAGFEPIPGDGWAHHPYGMNRRPDRPLRGSHGDNATIGNVADLTSLLRRLAARGRIAPSLARVHLTEFGYETAPIGDRPGLPLLTHARWLTWAERIASRTPGVVSFAQFLLRDQPPAPVRVSDSPARAFGQYYTGLEFTDGRAKPAARAFVAGLFARRAPDGRIRLWGRLRLGPGRVAVTVQQQTRSRAPWTDLIAARVGGRSAFSRTVSTRAARFRLRATTHSGRTVTGVAVRAR